MLTRYASHGAVASANHLAATAGLGMLERGGNAADAAIAAAATMAVTSPHMCGLGGDLFAVVAAPGAPPVALNASGRAGSGADPERVRGARTMPFRHEVAAVTVPGFVDGLIALHDRYARLELEALLAPARRLADDGFPVSCTLAAASAQLDPGVRQTAFGTAAPLGRGRRLRVPGVGRALREIATSGRAGFYEGAPGRELIAVGGGEFLEADLVRRHAEWVEAIGLGAFGRRLWSAPPGSQGYLTLAGAWIADTAGLPEDPGDERWAHVLIESARQAGFDRPAVLHEGADGERLISERRLGPRANRVREAASAPRAELYRQGDTTALCTVDAERMGVSLIVSNGANFGAHLLLPEHGIFLHNRGVGFSLEPGHPAEYGPGRRPPHTLSPLVVTDGSGSLDSVLGTMGGDAQPQILLQLVARLVVHGEEPADALRAARWVLSREGSSGFDTWDGTGPTLVVLEPGTPPAWKPGLRHRGHQVIEDTLGTHTFGHAQVIRVTEDGLLCGAADPRSGDGACVGR